MSEADTIKKTSGQPATVESLSTDFMTLGVAPAMTLLVHSSLSSMGWVCGGPVAVILALEQVLRPAGTLVMPTHSGDYSDPTEWENPPVPTSWWETIKQTMPAYDPDMAPTRGMGAIPECFRKQRDVRRSAHPQVSFAAWGKCAAQVTCNHALDYAFGEGSPLARVYDLEGWVLLLGVGHANNTSLHLAEHRATYPGRRVKQNGAPVLIDGVRQWVTMQDIDEDTSDFETIGAQFAQDTGLVRQGQVAKATALLMPQRALVDYAAAWMTRHRS